MAKKRVPQLEPHQWRPGQSGNPAGRPKGEAGFLYRRVWNQEIPAHILRVLNSGKRGLNLPPGTKFGECVVLKNYLMAMAGNVDAQKIILNRVDGSVEKHHNLNVEGQIDIGVSPSAIKSKLEAFFSGRNSQDNSKVKSADEVRQLEAEHRGPQMPAIDIPVPAEKAEGDDQG